jgi:phage portal protein BeeE
MMPAMAAGRRCGIRMSRACGFIRVSSTIAQQIAHIPFRISRGQRTGEDLIEEGKLFDLFQRPHPQLKRFQFWDLWVTWLMLRGEAFIVPYYAGNGRGRTRRLIGFVSGPFPACGGKQ